VSPLTERFAAAVRTLVSDGPLKQRLIRAYRDHLGDIDQGDLPAAVRRDFAELTDALQRRAPVGTGSRVQATVQKMSASEAGSNAGKIVQLYVALLGQLERAEPLKVVSSPSASKKAPRFLVNRP
jgi:hypothetical protein